MFFRKKQTKGWEKYFSDISNGQIILSKFMVVNCLDFCNKLKDSCLLSDFTNGQFYETIAFAKTFHFHCITQCQTIHNLFYGFYSEIHPTYSGNDLEEIIFESNAIKNAERWYMETYFNNGGSISSVIERFYSRLIHLQNENPDTHIKILHFEEFQQLIGSLLESVHSNYS